MSHRAQIQTVSVLNVDGPKTHTLLLHFCLFVCLLVHLFVCLFLALIFQHRLIHCCLHGAWRLKEVNVCFIRSFWGLRQSYWSSPFFIEILHADTMK